MVRCGTVLALFRGKKDGSMKKLILIGTVIAFSGCSHAYIASWNHEEVTACCPTRKIFCTDSSLQDLAKDRCGGEAEAINGATRATESYLVQRQANLLNGQTE